MLTFTFFFLRGVGCAVWLVGSQFPDQELNLCSLQWKHGVLSTVPPRNSLTFTFFFFFSLFLAALGLRCCARAFSSCGKQGLLFVAVRGLLIAVASLVVEHGLQACGLQQLWRVDFSSCGVWAQQLWLVGSRARAQQLWHTGLVALWLVGSSWTRDRTCVPCIGRQIFNHCTTRQVP